MMNSELRVILEFLGYIGVGTRSIHDSYLEESYRICKVFQRTGVTADDKEDYCHPIIKDFSCNAPGCNAIFQTLVNFEIHYNGTHRFTCLECGKVRPNSRLLEIHIQELHDSFFRQLADKKRMYQCFLSECELKFANAQERRNHCTNVHKFPKSFRYDERPKEQKSKIKNEVELMETDEIRRFLDRSEKTTERTVNLYKQQKGKTFNSTSKNIEELSFSVVNNSPGSVSQTPNSELSSALIFIPRQLTQKFYSKVLTKDKKMERDVLESDNMMDLAEALSS